MTAAPFAHTLVQAILAGLTQASTRACVCLRRRSLEPAGAPFLAAALVLGGCSTVPPEPSPGSLAGPSLQPAEAFAQRQAQLGQLHNWQASGRLAISAVKKSLNANVRWSQSAEKYTIHLSGPLGFGGAKLTGVPGHVTLEADGKEHVAQTPEELLAEVIGWQIPVAGLKYWLMGLVAPGAEIQELRFDDIGRTQYLEQSGWKIRFLRYKQTASLDMPDKVFMDSPGVKVRIVVNDWGL